MIFLRIASCIMMNIIIICSNIELFIQIEKKWKRNHSKNLLKKTNNLFLFVVLERRRLWKKKYHQFFFLVPQVELKKIYSERSSFAMNFLYGTPKLFIYDCYINYTTLWNCIKKILFCIETIASIFLYI